MKKLCVMLALVILAAGQVNAYEDFSTYTEVGEELTLSGDDNEIYTWWMNGTIDCGLYKSFGAGYFTSTFTHTFETRCNYSSSSTSPETIVWGVTDGPYTRAAIDTANVGVGLRWDRIDAAPGAYYLKLMDWNGNVEDTMLLAEDTWYWMKIVGNGTTVTALAYPSDADRTAGTSLVDSVVITLTDNSDSYSTFLSFGGDYGGNNNNVGGVSQNYDLGGAAPAATAAQIFSVEPRPLSPMVNGWEVLP